MEQYFIMQENQEQGPFDVEELALKKLKQDTLVWYQGLKKWKKACEIDELKILFIAKGLPFFVSDLDFSPSVFGYKANKIAWGRKALLAVVLMLATAIVLLLR